VTASESEQEHITLAELARWLRVSVRHVERLLAVGEAPPAIRLGRRIIFNRGAVRQWLESRTTGAGHTSASAPKAETAVTGTQPRRRRRPGGPPEIGGACPPAAGRGSLK
jgi:excisionase family DNA binding protein